MAARLAASQEDDVWAFMMQAYNDRSDGGDLLTLALSKADRQAINEMMRQWWALDILGPFTLSQVQNGDAGQRF